jgi:hypothetical protein
VRKAHADHRASPEICEPRRARARRERRDSPSDGSSLWREG